MGVRGRLGAPAERNLRLVFSSVTISALGHGVAAIALDRLPRHLVAVAA
jgi:hypothetical protein